MKMISLMSVVCLGLFGLLSNANSAQLVRNQPLLAAPNKDASVLTQLDRNQHFEILQRQGGWVKVRANKQEGWVRMLAIRRESASSGNFFATLDRLLNSDVRQSATKTVAVAGLRTLPKPKLSSHALILTIGNYRDGIPPLKGISHDADAAVMMANGMGVPNENIIALSDDALTLDGLRKAFNDLNQRIAADDQVFIYYSGHGTRLLAKEGEGERCAEALVAVDGKTLMDAELESYLRQLASKARRVVTFFDACHAGGVTNRKLVVTGADAANASAVQLTPKFWQKPGETRCSQPSNAIHRITATRAIGSGSGNFVHITSARADEISFDEAHQGGIATNAWLDCLGGDARDTDASGGLSVEEIQICAQALINKQVAPSKLYTPHHITVSGNSGMVLGIAAGDVSPSIATSPATSAVLQGALATLQDMYENRDDRRKVDFRSTRADYRIGKDRVGLSLTSSHAGHVYILMVGSDGSSFDMLFPNQKDKLNYIAAGETLVLPRAGWNIAVGGPVGQDRLLAIVSDIPRNFSGTGMRPAGPFSTLSAKQVGAASDMQLALDSPAGDLASPCQEQQGKRALMVVESCSDAYGAALLTIKEVE